MESITAYKNQHGQHRSGKKFMTFKLSVAFGIMQKILEFLIFKIVKPYTGTQEQPDTHVCANDMCALDEWPSDALQNRAQLQNRTFLFIFVSMFFNLQCNTDYCNNSLANR